MDINTNISIEILQQLKKDINKYQNYLHFEEPFYSGDGDCTMCFSNGYVGLGIYNTENIPMLGVLIIAYLPKHETYHYNMPLCNPKSIDNLFEWFDSRYELRKRNEILSS